MTGHRTLVSYTCVPVEALPLLPEPLVEPAWRVAHFGGVIRWLLYVDVDGYHQRVHYTEDRDKAPVWDEKEAIRLAEQATKESGLEYGVVYINAD